MEDAKKYLKGYKDGEAYNKKVPKSKAKEIATLWGEGSEKLTELIEFCILNDIKTKASCKGHGKFRNDVSYIVFEMPKQFCEQITEYLISQNKNCCSGSLSRWGDHKPNLALYNFKNYSSEYYFDRILDGVKDYVNNKKEHINNPNQTENPLKESIDLIFSKEGMQKDIEFYEGEQISEENMRVSYTYSDEKKEYAYSAIRRFCMNSKKGFDNIVNSGKSLLQRIKGKKVEREDASKNKQEDNIK